MLCGVDGSIGERDVAFAAARLARRMDAELALVHVVAPPASARAEASAFAAQTEAGRSLLDELAWDVTPAAGVTPTVHLRFGRPSEELIRVATTLSCDLIVIGPPRQRLLRRFRRLSVGDDLSKTAPCPVAQIRPGAGLRLDAGLVGGA